MVVGAWKQANRTVMHLSLVLGFVALQDVESSIFQVGQFDVLASNEDQVDEVEEEVLDWSNCIMSIKG